MFETFSILKKDFSSRGEKASRILAGVRHAMIVKKYYEENMNFEKYCSTKPINSIMRKDFLQIQCFRGALNFPPLCPPSIKCLPNCTAS